MDKSQCRRSSEYYASSIYEDDILSTFEGVDLVWYKMHSVQMADDFGTQISICSERVCFGAFFEYNFGIYDFNCLA